jgi:EAL domain-containing protein (putative c-di-GMP-specific phosphodiesterase class I)
MDRPRSEPYFDPVTLLPGPSSTYTGAPEERIAELLARPATVRSVNQPVVSLLDGRCVGYQATVRVAEWAARSAAPWFRAASRTGLTGQLGALALQAALRERATLPGERFLAIELDPDALGHPDVVELLGAEDDISDLVITLVSTDLPAGHPAWPVLHEFRARGLLLAVTAGTAGLAELLAVERLSPDLVLMPSELIRGVQSASLQQRLVDIVVELADEVGAVTLAEDVETLDETLALRSAGVRTAQGWLFGRARPGFAAPSAEVCQWLHHQPQTP